MKHNIVSERRFAHSRLEEEYVEMCHASGLRIYVFPKKMSTVSALYATAFGAMDTAFRLEGDANETAVPDGCAHFLEHKMFEEADGSDAYERFSPLGADANAYTSWDKTAYLFHSTGAFEEALSELLGFVSRPYFTKASVKKERGIIAEEIRGNDDSPAERCFMNLMRALYRESSIRKDICGSEASIAEITPEILYACHRVFYRPSNMVLVISGDVDPDRVAGVVDRILPKECDTRTILRRNDNQNELPAVHEPYIEDRMTVGRSIFVIGVKDHRATMLSAEERMRRDAAMTLLKEIYFSSSSKLYSALLDEGLISPSFAAGYGATSRYAFLEIAGESDDPGRVLFEVKKTIKAAIAEGIDRDAFLRAKRVMYAKAVKSFDSTRTVSEMLLDYVMTDYELFRYVDLYEEIEAEDVESLLREAFNEEYFALSVIRPTDESRFG